MDTDQLYHLYKPLLFSLAYRMMGSVMDAEDIVQEAFLSLSEASSGDHIRNIKAYLCKTVTNRCLDLLRSSAKKREMYVGPWSARTARGRQGKKRRQLRQAAIHPAPTCGRNRCPPPICFCCISCRL
ncbi:sigma-70 family RNA polymerase sigma factor [Paenibacillus sp. P26]|nr:sigma-70 family RNA polymerase sigma factor [Paenibacillus sp. P26]